MFRKASDEVLEATDSVVVVASSDYAELKRMAVESPRSRARICAHRSLDDPLHEMIIAVNRDSYVRPHRHVGKSESFHIMEGAVDVVIFDSTGEIIRVVELGEPGGGRSGYCRLGEALFHSLVVRSPWLVMHEVTNGPFDPRQTELADFAPEEGDREAVARYVRVLQQRVDKFLGVAGGRS
ncbi:WbuC family cupin fold metalloprotein [Endothiovibrio diazotrophicus]